MKYLLLLTFIILIACQPIKIAQIDLSFSETTNEFGQLIFYESTIDDVRAIYRRPNSIKRKYQYSGFLTSTSIGGYEAFSFTIYQIDTVLNYNKLGLVFHFDGGKTHYNKQRLAKLRCVRLTKNYPYEWKGVKIGEATFQSLNLKNDAFFVEKAFVKKVKDSEKYFRLYASGDKNDSYYYISKPILREDYPNFYELSDSNLQALKKLPIEMIEF